MGDTRNPDRRASPANAADADGASDRTRRPPNQTLAPPRNFTISIADRVRAAQGPPAYMRRKRHIEDLDAMLRAAVAEALTHAVEQGERAVARGRGPVDPVAIARRALGEDPAIAKVLAQLNRLITDHNRYYPVEANLPVDPVRRIQLDRDRRPYVPLAAASLDDLFAAAACDAGAPVGKIR
jgi:hypothetical protein